MVLTVAEATPASSGAIPLVASDMAGGITMPRPAPISSSGGSTAVENDEPMQMPVSQAMPTAAMAKPAGMTALGPIRGTRIVVATWAMIIRAAIIGRKATPVL